MASMGQKYDKGDKQGMTTAKVFSAPPENIKVIAGHNYRKIDRERVEMFKQMYLDKKSVPAVLVALGDNDELELVDGEHRVLAAREAGIPKIQMQEFTGSKKERLFAAWRFNQGSKGTPTENAVAFLRMSRDGYTNAEIARETGASEGTVANHLLLAMTGQDVLDMVDAGDVAATPVINLARSLGPDKVLAALNEAKALAQKNTEPKATSTKKASKKAAPKPAEEGKKFKTRKERITAKNIERAHEAVADKDAKRTVKVALKALLEVLDNLQMVQGQPEIDATTDNERSLTLCMDVKHWRELEFYVQYARDAINTEEGK